MRQSRRLPLLQRTDPLLRQYYLAALMRLPSLLQPAQKGAGRGAVNMSLGFLVSRCKLDSIST